MRLSWPDDAAYASYTIWRDTAPYFTPAAPALATVVPPPNSYDDAGAAGDPAVNYYYRVEGVPVSGESLFSPRLGAFDFALTPGE